MPASCIPTVEELMEGKSGLELLAVGRVEYLNHNYPYAATILSRASELLVEEHKDDKHNTLGNVYLYYGKTLLELSRAEGDPLGEAVPKEIAVDEEEVEGEEGEEGEGGEEGDKKEKTESGEEKVESSENKAESSENKAGSSDNKEESNENTAETSENKAEISINGEDASNSRDANDSAMDETAEGDEEEGEDDGEGEAEGDETNAEEDPSDLQLAWEVLELAKIILERRGESGREDYADCLITLGEVSLENENFESAIADITAGLDIQKEIYQLPKHARKLAETHYKLGMAMVAMEKVEEGIGQYNRTVELLKEKLAELEALESQGVDDKKDVKEIKELVAELEDKMADLRQMKDEVGAVGGESLARLEEEPIVSSPEKKATDISHLVKRKRKVDELQDGVSDKAAEVESPAKKPAVE